MSLNVVLLVMLYVIRFSMSLQGLGKQRFCGISTHDNRYMEGEADVKVEDVPTNALGNTAKTRGLLFINEGQ